MSKSVTIGSAPMMSVTADAATNRLVVSGMAYDANGNVTSMPGVGTLTYDARNRITGSGGVPTRGYDPGNRKIWWKDSNGITFVDYWLPNGEKLVTYKIDESPYYNNWQSYTGPVQFSTVVRNLYFAGRRVKVEGGPGAGWLQPDQLSSNARHHPYGEERGTSSTEYKFATYQREASGLDYALNRYYSSVYGRFLSSDPYRASGGPSDPGSWNRYAYVQGDPVNGVDPSGLDRWVVEYMGVGIYCNVRIDDEGGRHRSACAVQDRERRTGDLNEGPTRQQVAEEGLLEPCGNASKGAVLTINRYGSANGNPFGHISIKLSGQEAKGFYPTVEDWHALVSFVRGIVRTDSGNSPVESILLEITDEQAAKVDAYLKKRESEPGSYNFFASSCVRFARDAMAAGGIGVPTGGNIDPRQLMLFLKLLLIIGPAVGDGTP